QGRPSYPRPSTPLRKKLRRALESAHMLVFPVAQHDTLHVESGLRIGDRLDELIRIAAAELLSPFGHDLGAGIVRRDRIDRIMVEFLRQMSQVPASELDVVGGVE